MSQFFVIAVLTFAYFVAQIVLCRARLAALAGLFFVAPLGLTPFWIASNDFDPFVWLKIYSMMFCVSWAAWLRFTSAGDSPLFRSTIAWLLAGNVLEALVVDILGHGTAHNFNALAGLLLLATMPWTAAAIRIDRTSRAQTLRYDLPLSWIVGYSLWNWAFVFLNYPAFAGHHTAILLAALLVACWDPALWVQSRAATLGLNLLVMATYRSGTLAVHDASTWVRSDVGLLAAALAFGWLAIHALSLAEIAVRAQLARQNVPKQVLTSLADTLRGTAEAELTASRAFSS